MSDGTAPAPRSTLSAYELGTQLGDALPPAGSVCEGELELVDAARTLLDAVMRTALDDAAQRRLAEDIQGVIDELRTSRRDDLVRLVRHPDGRIENVMQAAAGRTNPRSLRLRFDDLSRPTDGDVDLDAVAVGRVVLDASCSGPPERAHGGIVSTILDEALGVAVMRTGRTGMTAAMDVSFRGPVPLDTELVVVARVVEIDGRKTRAEAELRVGDAVAATGRALFIARRSD